MSRQWCVGAMVAALVMGANAVGFAAGRAPRIQLQHRAETKLASASNDTAIALASADFDEDGVPDLVTGSRTADGGRLEIFRGNIDALYPNSPEANARRQKGEFSPEPFRAGHVIATLRGPAEFVGAGDFDADGHWDIVAAARGGSTLSWLRGDGRGNFSAAQTINVGGSITAFTSGEVNRVDGLTDLAVGIVAPAGARVLVFEGAEGALQRAPESFAVPTAVTDLASADAGAGLLRDLAIASGNEAIVVHGRDRKLSLDGAAQARVAPAQLSTTAFATAVQAVTFGDFAGDEATELAVLTADGDLHVGGSVVRAGGGGATRLMRAKVSTLQKDDLMVFGAGSAVQIVTTAASGTDAAQPSVAASVSTTGTVTAVLPMRLNSDAFHDLVVAPEGDSPGVIHSHGGATFVVNTTARTRDQARGDGICADGAGACSFIAAIDESNAHPGADTIHFNIPGGGVPTVATVIPGVVVSELHEAVTIDGTTQPGGRVEINSDGFTPLIFYGGNSVLRGVAIYGQHISLTLASANNIIEGNYIGFRPDGTKPSFTSVGGIQFRGGVNSSRPGNDNLVGGTTAQARNVISNVDGGTALYLPSTTGNIIQGNYIGLTVDGTATLPNKFALQAFDSPVTIGGTSPGAGNVFAGSIESGAISVGIHLNRASLVQGNRFGTRADGMQALPMGGRAIDIATNEAVTIGGTTVAARNVVAASFRGIEVQHDGGAATVIQGNYIGTNAAGTGALPNMEQGILMSGTRTVVLGGATAGARNVISGNAKNGLELNGGINGTPCRGVLIQGNYVGTDATGTIPLPNGNSGIVFNSAAGITVGGTTPEARNIVSGNSKHGLEISNAGFNGEVPSRFIGNFIGLNVFGTGALGNGKHGIFDSHYQQGLDIGGTEAGAGNRIAFNGGAGIASPGGTDPYISGRILSNSIYSNKGLGLDRGEDGVTPYRNTNVQSPVITSVTSSDTETVISGNLRTYTFGPQGPHLIQFFSNAEPDPTGYGEGQTFIGQTTITAGQSVAVPFTATITPAVPPGHFITAVAIGQSDTTYNGQIYTSEFAFNARVAGDATPANTPLDIQLITTASGGNTGRVTTTIVGTGVRPGITVALRLGDEQIVGVVNNVSEDGSTAQVSFDLSGRALGLWDVVVTNTDGSTDGLTTAFTIEQGRAPEVWVDLIGRSILRKGSPQTYHIVFGNRGNVDAHATVVRMLIPASSIQVVDMGLLPDGDKPLLLPDADGTTSVIFFVPTIAAGATETQTVTLLSPVDVPETTSRIAVRARSSRGITVAYGREADPTMVVSEPQVLESTTTTYRAKVQKTSATASGELEMSIAVTEASAPEPLQISKTEANGVTTFTFITTYTSELGEPTAAALTTESEGIRPNGPLGGINRVVAQVGIPTAQINSILRPGLGDISRPIGEAALRMGALNQQILRDLANKKPSLLEEAAAMKQEIEVMEQLHTIQKHSQQVEKELRETIDKTIQNILIEKEDKTRKLLDLSPHLDQQKLEADGICPTDGLYNQLRRASDAAAGSGCGPHGPGGSGGGTALDIDIRASRDPNEKVGAKGLLPQHYINGLDLLRYAIHFENQASATLPAQDVVITDQLDGSKLDLASFELGPVHFGSDVIVTPPPGLSSWTADIDLRPANNLIVRVIAGLDPATGIATWRFISLDPATMQPTEDPAAGFLPPNKTAPEGDGGVMFKINPKPNLADGTEIRNKARIVFDANPFIDTPEWLNTIDRTPPSSAVTALPATQNATRFEVHWSGSDAASGIGGYTIYVSENGGEYVPFVVNTTATSAFFDGSAGSTYSFYSVAQDGAGYHEAAPPAADASTSTPNPTPTPTPTASPSPTATPAPSVSPTATPIASATPTPQPSASPTATPTPTARPAQLLNIATRLRVQTGENVLIAGLIVTGIEPKKVILRAIAPSLAEVFDGVLADPVLELYEGDMLLASNDNWEESQRGEIEETTIPPTHQLESAIVRTLAPGFYTAVLSGRNATSGIAVIEAYDLETGANSKLANISSRGFVEAGDDVMIGGLIVGSNGSADTRVLVRALGPSLRDVGVADALFDPTLELADANGNIVRENDNWQESQGEIEGTGIPPSHPAEAAILATLPSGNYTAVVRGKNGAIGVGLIEVYNVD